MISRPPPTAQVLADAVARRHTHTEASTSSTLLAQEHEKRQMFRRLIDPGIVRPNSKDTAMGSLKTLSTIAENILREPENPKYHTFKHGNDTIKRRLIQPKGALEYALALGFRPQVMDFQSYYVFNPRNPSKMVDLRIGAAMLKEALDRETEKEERSLRNREEQKAAAAAAAQNVKLAFLDDRRTKMMHDQVERELRQARESIRTSQNAAAARVALPSSSQSPETTMPGSGYTLAGMADDDLGVDQPPPYHD